MLSPTSTPSIPDSEPASHKNGEQKQDPEVDYDGDVEECGTSSQVL